jgi:hypothetical protein
MRGRYLTKGVVVCLAPRVCVAYGSCDVDGGPVTYVTGLVQPAAARPRPGGDHEHRQPARRRLGVKVPGEADRTCTRGAPAGSVVPEWGIVDPAAGEWFPQQALLARAAVNPELV